MREIKFRAWHKELKTMCKVYSIQFGTKDYPAMLSTNMGTARLELFKLLQYTGLKDKNGKEIYEDHIVNIRHPFDKGGDFGNTNGRVFYWDGAYYHGNQSGRPPKQMWEYAEIIGNIYENPELLNATKTD